MSFNEILVRNLGDRYFCLPHGLYEGPIPSHNLKLYIEESEIRLGIGGHRISLDLPFGQLNTVDLKAICFVRQPLARIRSDFYYVKQLPGNVGQNERIRQHSYLSYLEYLLENTTDCQKIGSYQTQHLFGKLPINFEFLTDLIETKQLILVPLEKFDEVCLYLEKLLPTLLSDTSYVQRNVNHKKAVSHHSITSMNDQKTVKALEIKLSAELTVDNRLHSMAEKQFDTLISQTFSQEELLQAATDFEQRCLRRKWVHDPITRLIRKLYRVTMGW